ncbi:MAG: TIGR02301 family protein [Rhodobiaceae bacterium]|nr:TIGR02301 family protein [Rhodobiaceae bacterium]|tara:strand:+ start:124 stop:576 length:453 start_codon:yes stop_codon:yes gene_type:complete
MIIDYVRNRQQKLINLSSIGTIELGRAILAGAAVLLTLLVLMPAAMGATRSTASEADLVRLSEILGAVHHIREVCNANEGQLWRGKMQELLKLEAPDAALKELLIARFNRAYHQYRLAYTRCTGQARTDATRLLDEGAALTERLAARIRG